MDTSVFAHSRAKMQTNLRRVTKKLWFSYGLKAVPETRTALIAFIKIRKK